MNNDWPVVNLGVGSPAPKTMQLQSLMAAETVLIHKSNHESASGKMNGKVTQ